MLLAHRAVRRLRPHHTCARNGRHRTDPGPRVPNRRKYLLERVDDAAVVQLYADGFDALPLREKTLIWHLYQAALAGRDIFIDQKHRTALEMRGILDQIVAHPQGIDPATLAEIQRYTKLFWINNGPYNNLTARKFVLKRTPRGVCRGGQGRAGRGRDLRDAERRIARRDARRACSRCSSIPNVDPIVTNKTPPPGKDILTASANNLYAGGVSMTDLKGFTEKYGLNARLVKRNGKLVEEVYKIDGRYAQADRRGRPASRGRDPVRDRADAERAARADPVVPHRRGERPREVRHRVGADKASPVDTINGFIEVYLDPRGIKGSWEALVFSVNPGEDRAHQEDRRQRAVVRGPLPCGREVSQAQRHRASSPTPST